MCLALLIGLFINHWWDVAFIWETVIHDVSERGFCEIDRGSCRALPECTEATSLQKSQSCCISVSVFSPHVGAELLLQQL